jgi:hypothetical protein
MSYGYPGTFGPFCDGCRKTLRNERDVTVEWASGDRHYCEECWPHHRDYYEDESGRRAWRRVGNYYEPNE